jgi:hypothetical protein
VDTRRTPGVRTARQRGKRKTEVKFSAGVGDR